MDSFGRQARDGFYLDRGVELQSMELTRFDCADTETAKILQDVIQETTNKINRLTAQESENDVKAAALAADIDLEKSRTDLIKLQADNEKLRLEKSGEAHGMELLKGTDSFIDGLSATIPSVDSRIELYKMHHEMQGRNTDTKNLAQGSAQLFL